MTNRPPTQNTNTNNPSSEADINQQITEAQELLQEIKSYNSYFVSETNAQIQETESAMAQAQAQVEDLSQKADLMMSE